MSSDIAQSGNPTEASVNLLQMFAMAFRGAGNASTLKVAFARIKSQLANDINSGKYKGIALVYQYLEDTTEAGTFQTALNVFIIGGGDDPEVLVNQYIHSPKIQPDYRGRLREEFLWVVRMSQSAAERKRFRQVPSMRAAPPALPEGVTILVVPWEQLLDFMNK